MNRDPFLQLGSVGRCQILRRIGEGGMGVVYKGRHHDLELDVAIKFLHAEKIAGGDAAERFLREARLAARLNHAGIVRVFDCGEVEGHYFLVMEFVDGRTVADEIEERKQIPVLRSLQIAQEAAEALGTANEQHGIIHRDIKPGNLLINNNGQVKIADLGLAKTVTSPIVTAAFSPVRTLAGAALGTPNYMSPEQFVDASTVDHRADIFSLGATLYHMISGRMPFEGDTIFNVMKQVESADPAPLSNYVPLFVEEVVARMLEKNPEHRFQNYADLVDALRLLQHSITSSEHAQTQKSHFNTTASTIVPTIIPTAKTAGRTIRSATPSENRALIVVDIQNDFCPNGALAVPEGDLVVPVINKLAKRFAHVILTQDWHCEDHLSFASSHPGRKPLSTIELPYGSQILWPDHCVQGTVGAEFHAKLSIPHCELVLRKGYHRDIDSYSAFFENDRQTPTGLAGYLRERGLVQLFIVGLATDFCVAYSAIDAARLGFEVTVIENACRGIDVEGSLEASWKQMAEVGVIRA